MDVNQIDNERLIKILTELILVVSGGQEVYLGGIGRCYQINVTEKWLNEAKIFRDEMVSKGRQIDRWDPDGTLGACWHCGSEDTGFMLLANGLVEPRCDDCGQPCMGMYKTKEEAARQWKELWVALGSPPENFEPEERDV